MREVHRDHSPNLFILIPVYNDWDSLRLLLHDLNTVSAHCGIAPSIVIVDDGSTQPTPDDLLGNTGTESLRRIELIHLHVNVGHQSAISVGLSDINQRYDCDAVLVMDADGEDRAEDVERFVQTHRDSPQSIVVAQRSRRSEGFWFKIFYSLYKAIFRLFAGRVLDYGNFCLIPQKVLNRLVYNSMTWNHLAAAISRSQFNIIKLKTRRGSRFIGKSTMNFERLISHGLSAITVFLDLIMVRILIVSFAIVIITVIGILVVIWLRLFTDLAIPGWATSAVGLLSIIGLQGLVLSTMASFVVLRGRSGIVMIPAIDASKYVERVERILGDGRD